MKLNKLLYSTLILSALGVASASSLNNNPKITVQAKSKKKARVIKHLHHNKDLRAYSHKGEIYSNTSLTHKLGKFSQKKFKNKHFKVINKIEVKLPNGKKEVLLIISGHGILGYVRATKKVHTYIATTKHEINQDNNSNSNNDSVVDTSSNDNSSNSQSSSSDNVNYNNGNGITSYNNGGFSSNFSQNNGSVTPDNKENKNNVSNKSNTPNTPNTPNKSDDSNKTNTPINSNKSNPSSKQDANNKPSEQSGNGYDDENGKITNLSNYKATAIKKAKEELDNLRSSKGLKPLQEDSGLDKVADQRAEFEVGTYVNSNLISHTDENNMLYAAKVAVQDGLFSSYADANEHLGENIAAFGGDDSSITDPSSVADTLTQEFIQEGPGDGTDSDSNFENHGHYLNMVSPTYTKVGYGIATKSNKDGGNSYILVQVFS